MTSVGGTRRVRVNAVGTMSGYADLGGSCEGPSVWNGSFFDFSGSRKNTGDSSAVPGATSLMGLMQYATDQIEKLGLQVGMDGMLEPVKQEPAPSVAPRQRPPTGGARRGPKEALAAARTGDEVAWAAARREYEGMSRSPPAASPYTLIRSYVERGSDTDFATRARRMRPPLASARYLYTESRREALGRGLVDVLRRYSRHGEAAELGAAPALPDSMPADFTGFGAQFYLLHILDRKRRALVGCYAKWLRELEAYVASALAELKRIGLTKADFARMHEVRADAALRVADDVRAVFELFIAFEGVVDYLRHMTVLAEREMDQERRVRPHLDAIGRVVVALLQSPEFGPNEYSARVLRILTADLVTSIVKHEFITEHGAEYRQAVRITLKEIANLPARQSHEIGVPAI